MIHLEDWKLYLICIKQRLLTVHVLLSDVPLQMQQISHMNPVATSVCTVKVTRDTKTASLYTNSFEMWFRHHSFTLNSDTNRIYTVNNFVDM